MEAAGVAARPFMGTGALMRALGDDRLVARLRAGDQRAFEAIYDRHHRRLFAFCRHMLGNREEAEDVLQHTFAAAYRSLCESENEIQLRAWLFAIARNKCLSVLRARREQAELHDEVGPTTDGLHRQIEQRADLRELLEDMQSLPDEQRAALVLSELGAHSHGEIAMILDVRKDKVKALVFQARESLATSRRARETPCHEIQEQLATLRGGALRRAPIRRHVDTCPNCTAFKAEVQRQRAALAVILPAAPSLALKSSVLGPIVGGSGIAAGLGAGAGVAKVAGSAAGAGSGIAALGHGLAAKAAVTAAVVASVGGGGIAADRLRERATPRAEPQARPAQKAVPAAGAPRAPRVVPAPAVSRTAPAPAYRRPTPAPATRRRGQGTDARDRPAEPGRRNSAAGVAPGAAAPVALPPAVRHHDDDEPGKGRDGKRDKDKGKGKGGKQRAAAPQHAAPDGGKLGGGPGKRVGGPGERVGDGGRQVAAAPSPAPQQRKEGARHQQSAAPQQQAAPPTPNESPPPAGGSESRSSAPPGQQAPDGAASQQQPTTKDEPGTAPAGERPGGGARDRDDD